jgi:hypothetical protein
LWTYAWWPVSQTIRSVGESRARWRAMVSSTTPRVGAEVAAADGHRPDQGVPDLGGQVGELVAGELP